MFTREYCRYIRTYSELDGLQHAHTFIYCASATPQGALLELRSEQGGRVERRTALARCSFARAMQLMRYLCENGVEPEQWLEVLADAGEVCQTRQQNRDLRDLRAKIWIFVPYARFEGKILWQITQLTRWTQEFIL